MQVMFMQKLGKFLAFFFTNKQETDLLRFIILVRNSKTI